MPYLSVILVVLAACAPSELPLRIQPMDEVVVEKAKISDVRVELVQGPALPMAKLLSSAIAIGLVENGITASVKPNKKSRFVLKGRAKANWEDKQVPFVMLIYWTLYDMTGKAIGTYTQGVRGARWKWEFGDPRIIRAVGNGAAKPLAALIVEEEKNPLPHLLLGAGILVNPVTGAPGNGNEALRIAIVKGLRASDVTITQDRRQASLKLTGLVSIQPLGKVLDKVLVVWRVQTMDGFEVGRATQANNIPTGKLDGVWGDEAKKIAESALVGIKRIIGLDDNQSAPPIKNNNDRLMPTPDLEQIPSRTTPPPE
jgi:hypothetical protein